MRIVFTNICMISDISKINLLMCIIIWNIVVTLTDMFIALSCLFFEPHNVYSINFLVNKQMAGAFGLPEKTIISLEQGVFFYLLSLPIVYKLTNMLLPNVQTIRNGAPTLVGIFLHSIVFAIVTLVTMYVPRKLVYPTVLVVLALAFKA